MTRMGECELCGLHNVHGNSRSRVCHLCKLCVPCPEAIIPTMKLKRKQEQMKNAAAVKIARKMTETVLEQQLTANSQSSDLCPTASAATDDDDVILSDVVPCSYPQQTQPPISDNINVKRTVSRPSKIKCQSTLLEYFQT
ncbi:uncharacterized protein LOC134190700 isoform X2 [Corticium candelabrum]|uniref:uncharacterized protein LOC134190700 isoform X2 n=1 Tax=Corticium candelabrum TaxID=121492 RepID=UPI002E269005|nr:uncharacterized protein LOC134190700 isoform X2 [Corticium candelabrum]